ncbi:hypothetical protein LX36DRAFT_296724 [Colletotrichum falcatum]|nr:hypothetical protein LX36DRAFT_296724 [Colletotrichum falcatum]
MYSNTAALLLLLLLLLLLPRQLSRSSEPKRMYYRHADSHADGPLVIESLSNPSRPECFHWIRSCKSPSLRLCEETCHPFAAGLGGARPCVACPGDGTASGEPDLAPLSLSISPSCRDHHQDESQFRTTYVAPHLPIPACQPAMVVRQ